MHNITIDNTPPPEPSIMLAHLFPFLFYIFLIEYAGGVKIQKIKHNEQLVEVPGRLWELRVREPHCEHGHG